MRRDSQQAAFLQAALSDQGLQVGGRRLEAWSTAGLGPLPGTSFDEQVRHYAAVAQLSCSGHDVDVVALRLGARGLPCQCLRPVLLRRMGVPDAPQEVVPGQMDLLSDSSSEGDFDRVFVEVETAAHNVQLAESQHPVLHKILSAMRQNAARHAGVLDEAPEAVVHSYLVSLAWHMKGGEAYNSKAWAAIADVDPSAVGPDFEAFLDAVRPDVAACEDACRHMPLERIVAAAQYLADHASDFLARSGLPPFPPPQIEEACCMFAPWAASVFEVVVPKLLQFGLDENALTHVFREVVDGSADGSVELIGVPPSSVTPRPSAGVT